MTDKDLYSCTFNARVVGIPKLQYEKYVESKASDSGVRGFIKPVGKDMYIGKLEGTKFAIDFMKDVLVDSTEYYEKVQDLSFSKLTELNTFSYHSFHIDNDCEDELECFDFCDMACVMMEKNQNRIEEVKEIIKYNAKNVYDALQKNSLQIGQNVHSVLQPTIVKILDFKLQAACFLHKIGLKVTNTISTYCGNGDRPRRQGVQTRTVSFQSHAPF